MKFRALTLSLIIGLLSSSFILEKGDPFVGYSELEACKEEIPLYYATKKEVPLLEAAKRLQDVKIVLVTTNKKSLPTYKYYYIVIVDVMDRQTDVLVDAKDYKSDEQPTSVLFMGYKEKKHFFYRADCFDQHLKSNSELAQGLIMKIN